MTTVVFDGSGALPGVWTVVLGAFNQTGGSVYGDSNGASSYAVYNAETFGTQHRSGVVLNPRGGGQYIGPAVRCSIDAFTAATIDAGADGLYVSVMVGGVQTVIAGPLSTPVAGTFIELEADVADLVLYYDEVEQDRYEDVLTGVLLTNTRCGLVAYSNSTGTGATSWEAAATGGGNINIDLDVPGHLTLQGRELIVVGDLSFHIDVPGHLVLQGRLLNAQMDIAIDKGGMVLTGRTITASIDNDREISIDTPGSLVLQGRELDVEIIGNLNFTLDPEGRLRLRGRNLIVSGLPESGGTVQGVGVQGIRVQGIGVKGSRI